VSGGGVQLGYIRIIEFYMEKSPIENIKQQDEIISLIEKYKQLINSNQKTFIRLIHREEPDEEGTYEYQDIAISFEEGKWLVHETSGDSRMILSNMDRDTDNVVEINNDDDIVAMIKEKQEKGFSIDIR